MLDFSWVWAGPFATLQLAHLGADVIKVESPRRLCLGRRLPFHPPGIEPTVNTSGYYNQWNQGKRSLGVDLADPRGVELARRLAARSDVVVENFAVGVMDRLGLGYDELRQLRPDLIMASISGYGQTGPYRQYMGYGPTTAPLSGLASLTGYADDGKARELGIAFGDPAAGIQAALHVVAALVARRRTGRGQRIDVSLWEATAVNAVEGWMAWQLTGAQPAPMGNRDPRWAPCGCYPARGDEQWVTIACPTEDSWLSLRTVVDPSGSGPLWEDRLADAAGRKEAEDEVDALLAAWTADRDRWEVTRELQAVGVAAFPTLSPGTWPPIPTSRPRGSCSGSSTPRSAGASTPVPPSAWPGRRPACARRRRRWASTPTRSWPTYWAWSGPRWTSCGPPASSAEAPRRSAGRGRDQSTPTAASPLPLGTTR